MSPFNNGGIVTLNPTPASDERRKQKESGGRKKKKSGAGKKRGKQKRSSGEGSGGSPRDSPTQALAPAPTSPSAPAVGTAVGDGGKSPLAHFGPAC